MSQHNNKDENPSSDKDSDYDEELESISDDGSISLGSDDEADNDNKNWDEDENLDGFVVDDDEQFDENGNPMTMEDVCKELDKELKRLREPKLHLNPYPTYNPNSNKEPVKIPDEIKDEKDKIKWLIEHKLGHGMSLEDYVKFLEQQEEEAVDNYVKRSKRRKLDNDKKE
mgnify:CR=1 FL=1